MSETAQNNVNITNSVLQFRQDFAIISNWVSFGSKVLDLGCGDGELLQFLRLSLEVKGYGVKKTTPIGWLVWKTAATSSKWIWKTACLALKTSLLTR